MMLYRLACSLEMPPVYRRKIRPADPRYAHAASLGLAQGLRSDPCASFPDESYRELVGLVRPSLEKEIREGGYYVLTSTNSKRAWYTTYH